MGSNSDYTVTGIKTYSMHLLSHNMALGEEKTASTQLPLANLSDDLQELILLLIGGEQRTRRVGSRVGIGRRGL